MRTVATRRVHTAVLAMISALALIAGLHPPPAHSQPDVDVDGVFATAQTDPVAPGLDVTRFTRLEAEGWTAGAVLTADLSVPTLEVGVVNSGSVSSPATVSEHVATGGALAAVNGDFFDINHSDAARGTAISGGEVLNANATPYPALTVTEGLAAISDLSADASFGHDGENHQVQGVNTPVLPADGIGIYTAGWGDYTLDRPVGGPDAIAENVTRVDIADGAVIDVSEQAGAPQLEGDNLVLLGREDGAALLAELEVGDQVEVEIAASLPADVGITGSDVLLADGVIVADDEAVHPRTAVGVGPDGTELFVLALDGRAHMGRGMSLPELAQLMLDLGAHNAVNLDGGGSTTLVARPAGEQEARVYNTPSDGAQRPVPNALAFFSTAAGGGLHDVQVRTASEAPHADRVLPGLQRTVIGRGLDANFDPLDVDGQFEADGGGIELVQTDAATAVATGIDRGEAQVRYRAQGLTASTTLELLSELDHVRPDRNVIALEGTDDVAQLRVSGHDADGYGAPVETADIAIDAPPGFVIEPDGIDTLAITASDDDASGTATLTVAGHEVQLALTSGSEEIEVADLADADQWTFGSDRATGSVEPADGPHEGTHGLRVRYDFTTDTGTRGGYAIAPEPIELPGQPREIALWLHGNGDGEWPRLLVTTGDGVAINLDGPHVTWEGWQQVRFPVPPGTAYPLTFQRARMMETQPDRSYHGEVIIGPMSVVTSADVDPPESEPVRDPVLITNGTLAHRPLQIAVMSDAQFVARDPDSDIVAAARRTLAEIVDAEPDLLVINGDLVDEATPEDFALARRILSEEVGAADGDLPWLYVPGNHEIMGGPIQNFIDEFGPDHQALTLEGTQIITLNSASGSLRGSGFDQLQLLESELASAADDEAITGVMVFFHHPTIDPLPTAHSQLSDRDEAAAVERALAEFRTTSGKSAAVVNAHAGVFHARASEGVSYLVNGNSGKGPAGTPATGGFTGWTMLGVDPSAGVVGPLPQAPGPRLGWMRGQVNARVDDVVLSAPARLQVGEQAQVSATVRQDEGREVPVQWPMAARWGGPGVTVDDGGFDEAGEVPVLERPGGTVRYNPATGTLTGLAQGPARLQLTVNGVSTEVVVLVRDRR